MPYKDQEAQQAYQTEWYKSNKTKAYESSKRSRLKRLEKLRELKRRPCEDCGQEYHSDIMHFHHLDPATKDMSISRAILTWGWDRVVAETEKCVLLCANCHGLRHVSCTEEDSNLHDR